MAEIEAYVASWLRGIAGDHISNDEVSFGENWELTATEVEPALNTIGDNTFKIICNGDDGLRGLNFTVTVTRDPW